MLSRGVLLSNTESTSLILLLHCSQRGFFLNIKISSSKNNIDLILFKFVSKTIEIGSNIDILESILSGVIKKS